MKKILVIGCPGSGKSTFARELSLALGIKVTHLDMLFWNPDKTTVEREVFHSRLAEVLKGDSYIIDGNFSSTMEWRMGECDTVFFLDLPTDVCISSVRERRGKPRADIPWVETEEDAEFMEFIETFREKRRPTILELIEKYKKDTVIFTSRDEVNEYIERLK